MTLLRGWTRFLAAGSCLLIAVACGISTEADRVKRPNVLLIVVDTLRADHLGCYGYPRPVSPNIDRLAAGSVRFANAYAQASWTLPSVATVMTGLYPPTHQSDCGTAGLEGATPLLAEVFRGAGYRTAAVVTNDLVGSGFGFHRGFDTFDETFVRYSNILHTAGSAVDHFLRALDAAEDVPFFGYIHLFDPHFEYVPPVQYRQRYGFDAKSLYDGEIAYTDDQIGRLFAHLAERRLWEKTVILLAGDHGEEFGEHGTYGHGITLYQSAVHVPLILYVPGGGGTVRKDIVGLVDIAPTLTSLAGISPVAAHQGRSLMILPDREGPEGIRGVFSQIRVTRELPVVCGLQNEIVSSVRDGQWSLIHHENTRTDELHRVTSDPGETIDVAADYPEVRANLLRKLAEWRGTCEQQRKALNIAPRIGAVPADAMERLRALGYVK